MELKLSQFETILGPMVALADDKMLYLLKFADQPKLEQKIQRLIIKTNSIITSSETEPIIQIKQELNLYFNGQLQEFKTPICFIGSEFQQQAWHALQKIPYGEISNYKQQAKMIGHESSHRAVASANGANQLVILIPCHRIIRKSGDVGGYSGNVERKKWLIKHERSYA